MPLKISSLSVSTNLMYIHLSFQNIRPLRGRVNAQNYVFYFESDIAKVFPFRPTCSSYDSERKKKSKSEPKRTRKESEQMWQTWINSMGGFKEIFCDIYLNTIIQHN